MLLEIAGAPTAENSAILLDPRDNIAVARVPVAAGAELRVNGVRVVAAASIPAGHKVALRGIAAGEIVLRYGHSIGRASAPIAAGEHVHTHNLAFEDLQQDYEFPAGESGVPERRLDGPTFLGYRRGTGAWGRATTSPSRPRATAPRIQWNRSPAATKARRCQRAWMARWHSRMATGAGRLPAEISTSCGEPCAACWIHPNVSAGLMVGLGCEVNQIDSYPARRSRLAGLTLQSSGGTRATIEAARREVDRFIERAGAEKRIEAPASVLVLGLNCGGSDSFSGITANPALGCCSDLLAELGGSSVLAETPEIVGAEHLLVKRARNRQVAEKLLEMIRKSKTTGQQMLGSTTTSSRTRSLPVRPLR